MAKATNPNLNQEQQQDQQKQEKSTARWYIQITGQFMNRIEVKKFEKLGAEYTWAYIKLLLLAITKPDCCLEYTGLENSYAAEWNLVIDTDEEVLNTVIDVLIKLNLFWQTDDGRYYVQPADEFSSSSGKPQQAKPPDKSTDRVRKHREKKRLEKEAKEREAANIECNRHETDETDDVTSGETHETTSETLDETDETGNNNSHTKNHTNGNSNIHTQSNSTSTVISKNNVCVYRNPIGTTHGEGETHTDLENPVGEGNGDEPMIGNYYYDDVPPMDESCIPPEMDDENERYLAMVQLEESLQNGTDLFYEDAVPVSEESTAEPTQQESKPELTVIQGNGSNENTHTTRNSGSTEKPTHDEIKNCLIEKATAEGINITIDMDNETVAFLKYNESKSWWMAKLWYQLPDAAEKWVKNIKFKIANDPNYNQRYQSSTRQEERSNGDPWLLAAPFAR